MFIGYGILIKNDSAALAIVTITNKGSDAYKPDIYGDEIIIERKLLRDGAGQYKIKSSSNKTISTKREELVAICDHMSIQIDNPLTVLSQDMARQFLNSSSNHDKYMVSDSRKLKQVKLMYLLCIAIHAWYPATSFARGL